MWKIWLGIQLGCSLTAFHLSLHLLARTMAPKMSKLSKKAEVDELLMTPPNSDSEEEAVEQT